MKTVLLHFYNVTVRFFIKLLVIYNIVTVILIKFSFSLTID